MKKINSILIFSFIIFKLAATAPDSTKNEISATSDFTAYLSYSLKYSHRISEKLWLKTGVSYFGDYSKTEPPLSNSFTTSYTRNYLGVIFGIDKHFKTQLEKVDFVYGCNFRFNLYNIVNTTDNPSISERLKSVYQNDYGIGAGFTFALYYNFNKNFAIGSEINPYYIYIFHDDEYDNPNEAKITRMDYVLSNISIICLRFKW